MKHRGFYKGYEVDAVVLHRSNTLSTGEHYEDNRCTVVAIPVTKRDPNANQQLVIGNEYRLDNMVLEDLVEERFRIGDKVKSAGSFTGIVVGYELATNRAVCISDKLPKNSKDRTRYAYKVTELTRNVTITAGHVRDMLRHLGDHEPINFRTAAGRTLLLESIKIDTMTLEVHSATSDIR